MKPKKLTRKLTLKKRTVANLGGNQMEGVKAGGLTTLDTCSVCPICPTDDCTGTCETYPLTTCQTDGCSDIGSCRTQFTCTICECWCG